MTQNKEIGRRAFLENITKDGVAVATTSAVNRVTSNMGFKLSPLEVASAEAAGETALTIKFLNKK